MEPLILLFGVTPAPDHQDGIEARMMKFLASEPTNESLDAPEFSQINAAETKADWLLARRTLVGEMKTLNGDPSDRVEQRLQDRFARPGAPIVFGQMGMGPLMEALDDRDEVLKVIHDLTARKVRANLRKASEQIGAIRDRFNLSEAAGLAILMNDNEEMIDAANIGYSIKRAFEEHPQSYANVDYVWAVVESSRIRMPDGRLGHPQLLISKSRTPPRAHLNFLAQAVTFWGTASGGVSEQIDHRGDWATMQPVYKNGPPGFSLFT